MQLNIKKNIDSINNIVSNKARIIAVSKKQPLDYILDAFDCGMSEFGENYAQELNVKAEKLKGKKIKWHFIGPIQSNKIKMIARHAYMVHSITRKSELTKFNEECVHLNKKINILIQVNVANEENKRGIRENEINDYIKFIENLENINFKGIMTFPNQYKNQNELENIMKKVYGIHKDIINNKNKDAKILSMGTTSDFKIALKHGSNMLRLGESIFGARP